MQKSNECLLHENVLALMPSEFKQITIINSRRKLYQSSKGVILFRESQVYQPKNELWSGVDKDMLQKESVSFICLTAGFLGMLLIPAENLIRYIEDNDISTLKNGRTNLRIRIEQDKFFLYDTDIPELDLTHYFIPNDNDEPLRDFIQESPIEDIWQKAKAFVDYEEQYKEGYNIRLRHESKMQKERIARIENYTCQICGFHQPYVNANGKTRHIIQVDHIIEKSQGGGERMNNLLVLCPNCHAKKTYGVIKINPDYTFEENGKKKILKQNKHLNQ